MKEYSGFFPYFSDVELAYSKIDRNGMCRNEKEVAVFVHNYIRQSVFPEECKEEFGEPDVDRDRKGCEILHNHCIKCGTRLEFGIDFCPNCGQKRGFFTKEG